MAHVEPYTLTDGTRKYRVRWERSNGKVASKTFPRRRDADRFRIDVESRAALGTLYEEETVSLRDFYEGWKARYRGRVRPSTFTRLLEVEAHLRPFLEFRLDRIAAADVED